jgi:hypothetical protein
MIMSISENVCPVCKTTNEPDANVCSYCGAKLDDPYKEGGHETKTSDMQALTPEMIGDWLSKEAKEAAVPKSGVAFYVEGLSSHAHIDTNEEFVLGRKVGATSEKVLDLAPFGGYSMGLSRRHAVIRRAGDGYQVLDLGSVNGTWLNEERLIPHKSYPLPSGSHLRLGRMRLFVLYPTVTKTN